MTTNQILAVGWLVRRLEWECTLADLHALAHLDEDIEIAARPLVVPSATTERAGSRRLRALWRRRSPAGI